MSIFITYCMRISMYWSLLLPQGNVRKNLPIGCIPIEDFNHNTKDYVRYKIPFETDPLIWIVATFTISVIVCPSPWAQLSLSPVGEKYILQQGRVWRDSLWSLNSSGVHFLFYWRKKVSRWPLLLVFYEFFYFTSQKHYLCHLHCHHSLLQKALEISFPFLWKSVPKILRNP